MRRAENLRRREQAPTVQVLTAAARLLRSPAVDRRQYRELVSVLAARLPGAGADVDGAIEAAVGAAGARNWSTAEVERQTGRRLGARHAGYVRERDIRRLVTRDGLAPIDAVACAVEVLALLLALPALPKLDAGRPSTGRPAVDARVLEKVRALLAKAESTTFPEEAEALSAKAQQLMARHAIDQAVVGAGRGAAGAGGGPSGLRLPVEEPYAGAKSILLSEVASANRCRAVWSKSLGFSTVLGFDTDLAFVDVLYTSLLLQATAAMTAAGSTVDRSGRSRTRSFRQAFLLAYATRIGARLRAAEAASRAAAVEEYGEALLPVLADRSALVRAAEAELFPGAVRRSVSISNAAGWAAGAAAADLASLTGRTEMPAAG